MLSRRRIYQLLGAGVIFHLGFASGAGAQP